MIRFLFPVVAVVALSVMASPALADHPRARAHYYGRQVYGRSHGAPGWGQCHVPPPRHHHGHHHHRIVTPYIPYGVYYRSPYSVYGPSSIGYQGSRLWFNFSF